MGFFIPALVAAVAAYTLPRLGGDTYYDLDPQDPSYPGSGMDLKKLIVPAAVITGVYLIAKRK
jgi:hypothetical protein